MNKIILITLGVFFFFSCNQKKETEFIGVYGIDKYTIRDLNIDTDDYSRLEIKSDGSFIAFSNNNSIEGKWEIKQQNENEKTFRFTFENKIIIGVLRGSIFYFIFPNDFHNGKYESILYVKLINKKGDL